MLSYLCNDSSALHFKRRPNEEGPDALQEAVLQDVVVKLEGGEGGHPADAHPPSLRQHLHTDIVDRVRGLIWMG